MLRFCELTGLTVADIGEITGFIIAIIVAGVFAGNIVSWFVTEIMDMVFDWIRSLSGLVMQHIEKKWHR